MNVKINCIQAKHYIEHVQYSTTVTLTTSIDMIFLNTVTYICNFGLVEEGTTTPSYSKPQQKKFVWSGQQEINNKAPQVTV